MPPMAFKHNDVSSTIAGPPQASAANRAFAAAIFSGCDSCNSSRSISIISKGKGRPFMPRISSTSRSFIALPVTNFIDDELVVLVFICGERRPPSSWQRRCGCVRARRHQRIRNARALAPRAAAIAPRRPDSTQHKVSLRDRIALEPTRASRMMKLKQVSGNEATARPKANEFAVDRC